MKVVFILLAVLGLTHGAAIPAQPRDLNDDLQDFLNLIPTDEILALIVENLEDPEVQAVFEYIFSEDFKKLVVEIEALPQYTPIIDYLENAGLPVRTWIADLHDLIGLSRNSRSVSSRNLDGLIQQIKALLPREEIAALFNEKLETSPAFKELYEKLQDPIFRGFVDALVANPEIHELAERLRAVGVHVDDFLQWLKDTFGFNRRSVDVRDLNDDFQDFLNLIPTDEILAIIVENLEDPEIQAVFEYIFSEDFKNLVIEIEALPQYTPIIDYLENAGLPVRTWIGDLHDLIGLSKARRSTSRGLDSVIHQIRDILPTDEIIALYNDKLENSPAFKELYEKLQDPIFRGFVDALVANPEIHELAERLRAVGVHVDDFLQWLKDTFGFNRRSVDVRDLNDDFQDFLNLIPTDEILAIIVENLEDPEIQAVFEYIFSEDFKNLVIEIEALPQYTPIIDYLENAGLPVRTWIGDLHDLIGLPKARRSTSRGLDSVIHQIRDILPTDEIIALYYDKLENSPAFKELYEKLQDPIFRGFVDALVANPEIHELAERLRAVGVHVDEFLQWLKDTFGFNRLSGAERDLYTDLQDFLALIPGELILTVINGNLEDPEVQAVFEYIYSAEFRDLVLEVEAIPEYDAVYSYLEGAGLPVSSWVAWVHDLVGIARTKRSAGVDSRTLSNVIDDIISIFPFDQFTLVYNDKVETSAAFRDFLQKLKEPTFTAFRQGLKDNAKIQDVANRLRALNVDVDRFLELLRSIFGLN